MKHFPSKFSGTSICYADTLCNIPKINLKCMVQKFHPEKNNIYWAQARNHTRDKRSTLALKPKWNITIIQTKGVSVVKNRLMSRKIKNRVITVEYLVYWTQYLLTAEWSRVLWFHALRSVVGSNPHQCRQKCDLQAGESKGLGCHADC